MLAALNSIRPAMDTPVFLMDFARTESLEPIIGSGASITRTGGATRVGPTGLVEFAPENLVTESENFSTFTSFGTCTVSTSAVIDPEGGSAARLLDSATVNEGRELATFSNVAGQPYTLSVFIRLNDGSSSATVSLRDGTDATNSNVTYNLATGAFSAIGSSVSDYGAVDAGNGWKRVWMSFTASSATITPRLVAYTGDPALFFGVQLSRGITLHDYLKTSGAAFYSPRIDYDPVTLEADRLDHSTATKAQGEAASGKIASIGTAIAASGAVALLK